MKKLLICNIAYGAYVELFLNNHLKTLLDETNLKAAKAQGYEITYRLATTEEDYKTIEKHPNIKRLFDFALVEVVMIGGAKYDNRYLGLQKLLKDSIAEGHRRGAIVMPLVADLVFAKRALPKMLSYLEKGHDAVFCIPMRGTHEVISSEWEKNPDAEEPLKLFSKVYNNLHPVWIFSHFGSPTFTKMPYSLLWNTGGGLIARSYSVSPLAFKTNEAMVNDEKLWMIDSDLPRHFTNPFWASDWLDCPLAVIEPIRAYYPSYLNRLATLSVQKIFRFICDFETRGVHETQKAYLERPWYFPSKTYLQNAANESGGDLNHQEDSATWAVNEIKNARIEQQKIGLVKHGTE